MVLRRPSGRVRAAQEGMSLGICHHLLPGGRNEGLGTSADQKPGGVGARAVPDASFSLGGRARFQKGLFGFLFILEGSCLNVTSSRK